MMEVQVTLTQGLADPDYKYKTEKQKYNYYSTQTLPRLFQTY